MENCNQEALSHISAYYNCMLIWQKSTKCAAHSWTQSNA